MRRRTELGSIGSGVLQSFVSRNSEIDRYWAIGKLYSYARASRTLTVRINLLSGEIAPKSALLGRLFHPLDSSPLTTKYEAMLHSLIARRDVPAEWLSAAILTIEFESVIAKPRYPKIGIEAQPFLCTLELIDDLDHAHVLETSGWCWPHNPRVESASAGRR
jgi:hypothetical protein